MKNEHIVYAYAQLLDGGWLLLVGITDIGWEYLKREGGNFLKATAPNGQFSDVADVWIVRGENKQDIREMIQTIARQKGVRISEAH